MDKKPPLLNPVLTLLTEKVPSRLPSGGKGRQQIIGDRLRRNREYLPKQIDKIEKLIKKSSLHDKRLILISTMHDDSLSPSYTPDAIFNEKVTSTRLITSTPTGYLVETSVSSLQNVKEEIISTKNVAQQVDISRLKSIKHFLPQEILDDIKIIQAWDRACQFDIDGKRYKSFSLWLLPYISSKSKKSVSKQFLHTIKDIPHVSIGQSTYDSKVWTSSNYRSDSFELINDQLDKYISGLSSRVSISLTKKGQLKQIIASGTVCRIEPVIPPSVSLPPGEGVEPYPPAPKIEGAPVVAVVDGGLTAKSYRFAVAWEPNKSFIPLTKADRKHGNQVASLVIDATGWNKNLKIPNMPCRIAPVTVVPKSSEQHTCIFNEENLLEYLDILMENNPDTKVWNFSFNQVCECKEDAISILGHGLSLLSRKHNVLPIISCGNKLDNQTILSPPSDCESAIVVSGRKHNFLGNVDKSPCDVSRCGLGPHGTLRPDVSWYSQLRVLGGITVVGTSYATPLISRVAAHLFDNLKNPTPDIVKGIIINNTDLSLHNINLGWGSPTQNSELWFCPHGTVTIAWTSKLTSGFEYHWDNIYVPESMIDNGKLKGKIYLTAIHKPNLDETGLGQYYLSRLSVGLQKKNADGSYTNILPPCKTNGNSTSGQLKWNPVRVHKASFPRGTNIIDGKLRLKSHIFLRDRFRLESKLEDGRKGLVSDVAFVLTFVCTDTTKNANTYDNFVQRMGNNVLSAVIEHEVEVQT